MDNYREGIVNNLQDYLIGLDDTFLFKCMECGKCCRQREDILLNSRDLFNIAKKLGLTMVRVIDEYCESYIGYSSKLPIVRLLPRGANRVCPLLKGNKCSVHASKPSVCAAFPLGRVVAGEDMSKGMQSGEPLEIRYIINPISCGRRKHKHTVRSWLEKFNIPIHDEFYLMWSELISMLTTLIQDYEEQGMTEEVLQLMWHGISTALYMAYDTERDFMEQFTENHDKLLTLFREMGKKIE